MRVDVIDDEKTCADCLELQGKLFHLNANPVPHHDNCRCTAPEVNAPDDFVIGTIVSCTADGAAKVRFEGGLHLTLDLAGLIPGVGVLADVTNALVYLRERDYVNAALSLISAIPFVGVISGVFKASKNGVRTLDSIKDTRKATGKVDDTVDAARQTPDGTSKLIAYPGN